ncbi:uncharacterized protein KLTH0D08756g [Lachancea thermotolerans CBS 6340]|uniref:KLTH0D08756p n=1 Tax=Lachancea thermotolerans (strain ATCC 56472 / CBS 6340 / NRRL Y-8284) TaxID=559295 RepID=C5DGW2_LACTC|nr:KLTH0D08756p [Lachancea thermotolerans CBS 6340]CAR22654.1 KLTH0D08756p [Lachancea thermotolerans CBS 6340]
MQGGVRRKNDLLPRYRGQAHSKKQSFLTTPMKKVAVYVMLLIMMYLAIKTVFVDPQNAETKLEIESAVGRAGAGGDALEAQMDAADLQTNPKVSKERFNNEVVMQQETKNLENEKDFQKQKVPTKNTKQEVGNDVKAVKPQFENKEQPPVDEQARRINEKAPYKKTDKKSDKAVAEGGAAAAAANAL